MIEAKLVMFGKDGILIPVSTETRFFKNKRELKHANKATCLHNEKSRLIWIAE